MTRPEGEALSHWATHTLLWDVGAATVLGLGLGYGAGRLIGSDELLAAAVLLLRRPPVLLLLRSLLPDLQGWHDALFMGWFGPVAVAAVYYASLMEHRLGEPVVWDVTTLVVCASVVVHGVSAVPLTRLYGRWAPGPPSRRRFG